MHFSSFFATVALTFFSAFSNAIVIPRGSAGTLDVFVPRIISPNATTTWTVGKVETVTWDTSNAPVNISNGASVYLKGYGRIAGGFDLRSGSVEVKVPHVVEAITDPDHLHTIILFGDSGNESEGFKIVSDSITLEL